MNDILVWQSSLFYHHNNNNNHHHHHLFHHHNAGEEPPMHHAPLIKIYNILVEYDNGTLHLGPKDPIINKINKLQDYTHIHIYLLTYKHVPYNSLIKLHLPNKMELLA